MVKGGINKVENNVPSNVVYTRNFILYLFTGFEDDSNSTVRCPQRQELFHRAKPREIVAFEG